jgi:uncharacterized zinc-type alcohol dehydrogenase-like protein
VQALRLDGTLCSLGLLDRFDVSPFALATGRRSIASSGSGGTRETREMLAFCADHGITADVETVAPADVNSALHGWRPMTSSTGLSSTWPSAGLPQPGDSHA